MTKLTFTDGKLTDEALTLLRTHTDMLECRCPSHLLDLLEQLRKFRDYTLACADKYPDDVKVHRWLAASASNIDEMMCDTLVQLARLEGYLTGENNLVRPG